MDWEKTFGSSACNAMITGTEGDWIEAWGTIAAMKYLRQLRIGLQRREFGSIEARKKVAEPMMRMRGLALFELLLSPEEDGQWGFLEDAPFTIVVDFSAACRSGNL
jgi:hypothetical protein